MSSALRLAVTRGGLAIELGAPVLIGPLEVSELSVSLAGLQFPVDLSGGVSRFRHRRGVLDRIAVTVSRERATVQWAPRLRGILDPQTPALTIAPVSGGLLIGIASETRALAFEMLWAPSEADARWVIANARALGLREPAVAAAAHAVDALIGRFGTRAGAIATVVNAPLVIARELLPAHGARAPEARDIRWGPWDSDPTGFRIACDRTFSPALLPKHVIGELELARLTEAADQLLAAGNLDAARDGYARLLERSPRDTDLARRLADLDRVVGGRSEAALSTLLDAMPPAEAGALGAELLAAAGDRAGAAQAFRTAAAQEPYGPLAALSLLSAAFLHEGARDRGDALDEAVARAPLLTAPRWRRLEVRLNLGDLAGATADAEHLEAATRGAHARHEVWRRAGEMFLTRGHGTKGVSFFERALRYVPDDPRAVAGLARSLLVAGRPARALDLLARAADLADHKGVIAHDVTLHLARALAETAGDLPHAVARARTIPPGEPESIEARGLEGRWRASLGDVAGASIAFGAMRETIELARGSAPADAALWLLEAARFERDRGDPAAEQRHLAVALALVPADARVVRAFRDASAKLEGPKVPAPPSPEQEAADDERAQKLSDRLRANPEDDAATVELCDVLTRLGRDMDLLALLSARLEDAAAPTRTLLLPRQRAVLARLRDRADREGRGDEARLFADALARAVS